MKIKKVFIIIFLVIQILEIMALDIINKRFVKANNNTLACESIMKDTFNKNDECLGLLENWKEVNKLYQEYFNKSSPR